MAIPEAYCEQLKRIVGIYEAQEEYFDRPASARRRFVFRCADETCRAANWPLIVGVNYDKDAEDSETYLQPHFKTHPRYPHIPSCLYSSDQAVVVVNAPDGAARGDSHHPHAKITNVIDVFTPRSADIPRRELVPAEIPAATPGSDTSTEAAPRDPDATAARAGVSRTSRLETVIDCWSQLSPEERPRRHLSIAGRPLGYDRLCVHLTQLRPDENGERIVYGGAHARPWPEHAPTLYFVNFIDRLEQFPEANGDHSLVIALPIDRLRQSRRGGLLTHRIEQSSRPDHYLRVYAWGVIVPRGRRPGYQIEVASLGNLVLKSIQKTTSS